MLQLQFYHITFVLACQLLEIFPVSYSYSIFFLFLNFGRNIIQLNIKVRGTFKRFKLVVYCFELRIRLMN